MKSFPVLPSDRAPFLYAIASTYATFFFRQCNILRLAQCADIVGKPWTFHSLAKNKWEAGGFIAPGVLNPVAMQSANGWKGEMSPEACGIAISMCSFSILSFSAEENGDPEQMERLVLSYRALRDWTYTDHPEAAKIAAFCD